MFSIIVCSISPERLSNLSQNIHDTIGVEYELIGIDNRTKKWPIAKVYNEGARQARYPYLFFVHEDVKFHTKDWGIAIAEKLAEPDCGAIGFAGSKVKLKAYSGWGTIPAWSHVFMFQGGKEKTYLGVGNVFLEQPFAEVITLDGLGLFVRKNVWEQYPFDEKLLKGFHCYDLDFSLQLAATRKYRNYVCCTPKVLIEHFSLGSYNAAWVHDTIRMHRQKWNAFLPLKVESLSLSTHTLARIEEKYFHKFVRKLIANKHPERSAVLREFLAYSFSWRHLTHSIGCLWAYCFK